MIKYKNRVGWTVYKVSYSECLSWGGASICDDCGTFCSEFGYLIPVLNHFMCEKCFQDWNARSKFHPEDVEFENSIITYYEYNLPFFVSDEIL